MQRISEDELFPIKSAAAKRAGETKKACREIETLVEGATAWYGQVACPELNAHLGIPNDPEWGQTARFKMLLIKRAQSLCSEVVIRRRQGGLVFETKVTLESMRAAFHNIVGSVDERFRFGFWAAQQQQANGGGA
jgi:hypothetical protein